MSRNNSASTRDRSIPRIPLLWLAAALLFTLPPMFGSLVSWVPCFFLLALTLKFWMEPKGYRLRFATLKLLFAVAALFAIFVSYGSLKGIEPGVSLLVVLMSLKILEAHTAREFQVMVLMGWVLCLCGFFLSQDFAIALCLLTAFALLLVALIQFHRGSSPGTFWPPLGTTLRLLVQAAPLVVLLFLLFPRINTGLRVEFRTIRAANSGFSDRLSPGSIAALANSVDIAFRAEFPGSKIRPPGPMYWRGVVMWHCDGMEWRGARRAIFKLPSFNARNGAAIAPYPFRLEATQFARESPWRRMVRTGCLPSTDRLKSLPAPSWRVAIISGASSQFESGSGMKSFHLQQPDKN